MRFIATLLTATLLLFTLPVSAVEEITAKAIPVGGDFEPAHMEGGALGADGTFYYTNNPGDVRGIFAVDLGAPEKGTRLVSKQVAGGTWLKNDRITFCAGKAKQVLQIDLKGNPAKATSLVDGLPFADKLQSPNDLVGDDHGGFYFTEWKGKAVYYINGEKWKLVASYKDDGDKTNDHPEELSNPNGIILSADQKTLYVTDSTNILFAPLAEPGVLAAPLRQLLPGRGVLSDDYAKRFNFSKTTRKKKGKEIEVWVGEQGSNLNIDGMTVDSKGTIYGAGLGSGVVYGWDGKTGKLVRAIRCPGGATNCTVGRIGADEYIVIVGKFGIAKAKLP
jgi:sugar lactone lactonase YvrE